MRITLATFSFLLFFASNLLGQGKDDAHSLKLDLLMKLAAADLTLLDEELEKAHFVLGEGKPEADFVSYHYIDKNTFILKRYISRNQVVYSIQNYTDGLKASYADQIRSLKFNLKETSVIENGLKRTYFDPTDKWVVNISKSNAAVTNTSTLIISIQPK